MFLQMTLYNGKIQFMKSEDILKPGNILCNIKRKEKQFNVMIVYEKFDIHFVYLKLHLTVKISTLKKVKLKN